MVNQKGSEQLAILGGVSPLSQAAGAAVSAWVSMAQLQKVVALISVGVFGASATIDANFLQAQDNAGTGSKAIGAGKAITQILAAAGNNIFAELDLDQQELDTNNGFSFVKLTITVGTAATLISGVIVGVDARNQPASSLNPVAVVQISG